VPGPSLRVVAGPAAGASLPLGDEGLVVGRAEAEAGKLGDDPELSRRHARFFRQDDRVLVEDLGSRNGTFVNGARIGGPTVLRSGDEVSLGATTLAVVAAEQPKRPPEVHAPPSKPPRRPALRVVAGWAPGALIAIGEDPVTVGRGAAGASALGEDPGLAAQHVKVSPLSEHRVLLEDLGSERGTLIQGERIPGPTIIGTGDRFQIGDSTLELVEVAGSAREPRAEPSRAVGGVRQVPEGLFALIAARAPVGREEVTRVFLLSLGWALAGNLLIRTAALEAFTVPHDLRALEFPGFLVAIVLPVFFNSFGFYKSFRRPSDASMRRFLIPTFGIPAFFVVLNVSIMNHRGAVETAVTVALTVLPPAISTALMLRLREKVAEERLGEVRVA
jgi:pSer/pThr/pTyr-binding forkhead associated (FHA) protein